MSEAAGLKTFEFEAVTRPDDATARYLDLLNDSLTGILEGPAAVPPRLSGRRRQVVDVANRALARWNLEIMRAERFDLQRRLTGSSQPLKALTQMSRLRLRQLEAMVRFLVAEGIEGDVLEAGAWRGGSVIFLRATLDVLGAKDRTVWAADSFAGYPPPGPDAGPEERELYAQARYWTVTRTEIVQNLERYRCARGVEVLEGWFDRSLPEANLGPLAMVRVDVDGYEGVRAALEVAWPKLASGGFVIVEDVEVAGAYRAATDVRRASGVTAPWRETPGSPRTVYWRKP
ncbi:MAG: TylF/MycF/NovP-related O-methyltransferase [Myxococcota bacterium]